MSPSTEPSTRKKTGGRVRPSVDELLERAARRSKVAELNDGTLLEAPLAALFLGLSENELYELRNPPPDARGVDGPVFLKHVKRGAIGQNQPVRYPLGELRRYVQSLQGVTSHEVALKSGLLGWVSREAPYFVQPDSRRVIVGAVWRLSDPDRERKFARVMSGDLDIIWITAAEAVQMCWAHQASHEQHSFRWRELLGEALAATQSAAAASASIEAAAAADAALTDD